MFSMFSMFSVFSWFPMFSQHTPCSLIRDGRMEQLVEPCLQGSICWQVNRRTTTSTSTRSLGCVIVCLRIPLLFVFCISLSFFHRLASLFSCGRAVSSINTSSFRRIIHELTLGPRYRGRASISDKPSRFTTIWKNSSDFDDHLNIYGEWWLWLKCWSYKAVIPS